MQRICTDPVFAVSAAEAVSVVVPAALETDAAVNTPLYNCPSAVIDQLAVDAVRVRRTFRLYLVDRADSVATLIYVLAVLQNRLHDSLLYHPVSYTHLTLPTILRV